MQIWCQNGSDTIINKCLVGLFFEVDLLAYGNWAIMYVCKTSDNYFSQKHSFFINIKISILLYFCTSKVLIYIKI